MLDYFCVDNTLGCNVTALEINGFANRRVLKASQLGLIAPKSSELHCLQKKSKTHAIQLEWNCQPYFGII
jgi:hypothetical protein